MKKQNINLILDIKDFVDRYVRNPYVPNRFFDGDDGVITIEDFIVEIINEITPNGLAYNLTDALFSEYFCDFIEEKFGANLSTEEYNHYFYEIYQFTTALQNEVYEMICRHLNGLDIPITEVRILESRWLDPYTLEISAEYNQ